MSTESLTLYYKLNMSYESLLTSKITTKAVVCKWLTPAVDHMNRSLFKRFKTPHYSVFFHEDYLIFNYLFWQ